MAWSEAEMRQIISEQQAMLREAKASQLQLHQENRELKRRIKDLTGLTPACDWCGDGDVIVRGEE